MIKRLFRQIWPVALIFLVVAIFFYPVFLQGKIPLPADFVVGTYYPWLDYKWAGYNAGVPVKNPITTDVVSFIYPIQMLTLDLIKEGMMPLWNNFILSGTPLLANFQSAPFSPTNIFYFVFPKLFAWSLQIMAQPFLAALFLYLLLRNFGISKLSSVAGGLFYGFAGFMTIWMQWNGHALVAAIFPLVLLLCKKWLENQKFIWGALLSITLALQIFSGYPQIVLYEFLALFLLISIFDKEFFKSPKKILSLVWFISLGISLAAVQILPGLELLHESQRGVETVLNRWAFLPPQLLITFLAPDYFGNHATYNYWGPADYTLTTGFSGVMVATLACLGFLTDRKNRPVLFGFWLVILALVIALPNPVSLWIKESGFLRLQAASAHRALVLSNLGFAILAAFGLDSIILGKARWRQALKAFSLPTTLLFGFAIGTFSVVFWLKNAPSSPPVDKAIVNFSVGIKNLILPIVFLLASAAFVFLSIYLKKFRKIFVSFLITLTLFELFKFGWKFTPFSPKEFVFPQTPVLDFLQKQQKPFRITAEEVVPINMMMPYALETVEGYDAVYPLRYSKFLAVLNSNNVSADPMGRYGSVSNIESKLFDLVNGKFVLALKRDEKKSVDKNGQIPQKFLNPKFKKVFEDKTVVVLENTYSLPRAFFISDWVVKRHDQGIIDTLLLEDFPLNKKIVLEDDFSGLPKSSTNQADAHFTNYQKGEIELRTNKPGFLFISQNFYPGWKATVDGVDTKILRADYTFSAVPILKEGVHTVKIYYDPQSLKLGITISLISILILGIIMVPKINEKFT